MKIKKFSESSNGFIELIYLLKTAYKDVKGFYINDQTDEYYDDMTRIGFMLGKKKYPRYTMFQIEYKTKSWREEDFEFSFYEPPYLGQNWNGMWGKEIFSKIIEEKISSVAYLKKNYPNAVGYFIKAEKLDELIKIIKEDFIPNLNMYVNTNKYNL